MKNNKQANGCHRALVFIGILFFVLLLVASPNMRAAEKELKVGVVTSFKMECGTSTLKAVQMAAEEINAKGGILGQKIKVLSADTESDSEKSITALKRLVERDKVDVLLGGAVSGDVLAQMEYLKPYNKIFLAVGPSSPLIAKKVSENYDKYKYLFRPFVNSLDVTKALVEDELSFMVKRGLKNFAILREDAAWNRGLADYVKANLPKFGGTVVETIDFDPKTIDFAPIFSKVVASKAEVAIPIIAHTDTIALYKQWYGMKPPFRMVGINNPGMNAKYWDQTSGACLSEVNVTWGVILRAPITAKSIPFFDSYIKNFKEAPHACASTAYDAAYIFTEAVKKANGIETESLIKALEATDFLGSSGRYVFDKKTHDAIFGSIKYCPILVTQWQKGGKFEILLPKEIATAEYQEPPWLK